ncbi:MAG: RidA family protein [Planctomycetota bacterium]|jgi:2-iminobutanoate/2-iminopropanoate deaminase
MKQERICSTGAPQPIGPYAQAVRAGDLLFCSGQIPVDPKSGELVDGTVAAATERVLLNLQAVVEEAGLAMASVVKTTVYLQSMDDFAEMNGVYERFFSEAPPARACVEVARLPKGVSVEIDAIAVVEE